MSTIPTPPSMTRYTRSPYVPAATSETSRSVADSSLDSLMRRVGLNIPGYGTSIAPTGHAQEPSRPPVFSSLSSTSSIPSFRSAASSTHVPQPAAPLPEPLLQTPEPPQYDDFYDDEVIGQGGGIDPDSSSDSLDYEEAHTPRTRPSYDDDDSFDSSMDDDDPTDDANGVTPVHPFLVGPQGPDDDDGFDDDSFDDETVFGVAPAQRLQQQAQHAAQFRMLGEDLLQDTFGIGSRIATAGRVEESPTPWVPPGGHH
ncbi:hypothetical protein C2E23DRAFT_844791 [Lenzites betulinus]|nr:hypothetical protein C2E23DRAFT_844791 [Lenzites betulinus]